MKNKSIGILFTSITIAMIGYGIALPLLPFYMNKLGGAGIHLGLLVASYGVMQLIFAPIWGSLSDRYGRKPILIVGMFGLGTAMIFFGISTKLWMLYMAQILNGTLSSAMFPVAMAYVSDIIQDENKSGAMGKIGAAAGLGMILGPGIGGILAIESIAIPFFIAAGFCLLTCIIIMVLLPESLPKHMRNIKKEKLEILQIKGLVEAMFSPMAFGLLTAFAVNFGKSNFSSIFGLYSLAKFGYGPQQVGSILMIMSFVYLMAQGVLVGPLSKKLGEENVIKIALMGNVLGFIFMIMANSYSTIVLSICIFILFNALLKPSALAFVSKHSTFSQGKAMGITESFISIGRIFGPLWAGFTFDINMHLPFISGMIFFFIIFFISLFFSQMRYKEYKI